MFGLFKKSKKVRSVIVSVNDEDLLFAGYHPLDRNEEVLKCAHKIADLVSDMTIMLLENGENGDKRVYNALSYKIDVEPNSMLTRKPFVYRIVKDMVIYGNSVVQPIIKDGLIEDLKLFDMREVSFRDINNGESYKIYYRGKLYEPDELLHFVLAPSEDRPYMGEGFAPQIKETIDNLGQANKTKSMFLRSKWKPPMIISVNSDAEELEDPEKRDNILNSYVSNTDEGKPWLIPADEVKVQTVRPLTLGDLKVSESIELDKRVIAATFGVPPFLLGIGQYDKDEYNTFISTVIYSFGMIIQQELTRKLLYKAEWYFKFNARSLMQYSLAEKTSHTVELMKNGMLSRNEGRNEFDYSPVDNEGMDEYVILENFIPVAKVGEQEKLLTEKSRGGIIEKRYSDDQPRDDDGRFTETDGENSDDNGAIEEEESAVNVSLDNDKYTIAEDKLKKFLLLRGAKHSQEFFDVGYTEDDWQKLNDDIYNQFDENKATDFVVIDEGDIKFSVFMELGVTKVKRFRTVWQKNGGTQKPRLITAHREDVKE